MESAKKLPFKDFVESLKNSDHEQYSSKAGTKVKSPSLFEEMKNHLIQYYDGLEIAHSFKDSSGQIWDCIPIDQQPSIVKSGKPLAKPKDIKTSSQRKPINNNAASILNHGLKDDEGNTLSCPDGYVPLRRLTLEELTRFRSLKHFFQKAPDKRGHKARPESDPETPPDVHKYAHAYQGVNNIGGHSYLNVWAPKLTENDEVFSLTQHWYTAGPYDQVQTVECGWQVYPGKYNNSTMPCLFIYWTADGYNKTGSYNNEDHQFVQTSSAWALGAPLPSISVIGGAQAEIEIAWYLTEGNWWLYINGLSSENALGYFPTSIYQGGPLKDFATEIDYGGEVVGATTWPQMGSGDFADQGYQQAAYQRNIYYFDTNGNDQDAALTPSQQSPACFTIKPDTNNDWGEFFFFGGPGGSNCEA